MKRKSATENLTCLLQNRNHSQMYTKLKNSLLHKHVVKSWRRHVIRVRSATWNTTTTTTTITAVIASTASHGSPQEWARGGGIAPLPWKCWKVFFLLQLLSKASVDEVFMHHSEKMSSVAPRLPLGSCPWTLLGDFRPSDPLIAHPWKKSCGCPWGQWLKWAGTHGTEFQGPRKRPESILELWCY